jgi:hypothetical protein
MARKREEVGRQTRETGRSRGREKTFMKKGGEVWEDELVKRDRRGEMKQK